MSVNFSPDNQTRAWLASLPGMGDAFPDMGTGPSRAPTQVADANGRPADGSGGAGANEEMSFWDFLDVINPLQHIPIVNHLYRAVTGDTIKPQAQIIGSTLFGGPLGFAVATATSVVEAANGESIATTVARAFGGDQPTPMVAGAADPETPARQAMALTDPAPVPTAPAPAATVAPPVAAAPASSPSLVPTAAAAPSYAPPQPVQPQPIAPQAAGAPAQPSPAQQVAAAAPTANRGPTDYFSRLQNPGGSKSVRPVAPPSVPQSLGQNHSAVSAPGVGSFRPTRIPAYVEPSAAEAQATAAQATPAQGTTAPATAAAASTPAAEAAPAPAAPPAAPTVTMARTAPQSSASTPAPANADAGRKPSRDEISSQMLRALDRYQAAQRIGERRVTPVAGGVF